nr:methyltransferase [Candidatus Freyarchaeota archaeon]
MCGIPVAGVGAIIMLAGMIEFRSLRRISGVESRGLLTTGVYRWSRNPQYVGWYLILLGVSLIGASALVFLHLLLYNY